MKYKGEGEGTKVKVTKYYFHFQGHVYIFIINSVGETLRYIIIVLLFLYGFKNLCNLVLVF